MGKEFIGALLSNKHYQKLESVFFDSPSLPFVLFWLAIAAVKSGIWVLPCINVYREISFAPFAAPPFIVDQMAHYLFYSWLLPFFAWAIGATTLFKFVLLSLVASLGFLLIAVVYLFRSLPRETAKKSLLVFLSLPMAMTSLYWVGYDGLTLLLMLIGVILVRHHKASSQFLPIIIGFLLGLQHFEQGLFSFSLLLAYFLWFREATVAGPVRSIALSRIIAIIFGILLGRLALGGIIHLNHIPLNSGRQSWVIMGLKDQVREFFLRFQPIIYSFLGVGWVPASFLLLMSRKKKYWFAVFVFMVLLAMVCDDQTRVVAIVSMPILYVLLLDMSYHMTQISRPFILAFALLYIIVPMSWVWGGVPQASSFSYGLLLIQAALRGLEIDPAIWNPLPFIK